VPPGGTPTRERCLSVGTPKAKEQAVALVAAYRAQEEIASVNDINSMSEHLDKLSHVCRSSGGLKGEMLRRRLREADMENGRRHRRGLLSCGRRQWT
jgi:hypothetical protein